MIQTLWFQKPVLVPTFLGIFAKTCYMESLQESYPCWCSVVQLSDSLRLHGLQHASPPCPSPSPEVCPSLHQLHLWYHPAVSSFDTPFSFFLHFSPTSGTFPMSQQFASGDQNTEASASASVLPMSIRGWFALRLTGMSLVSKGLSVVFSSTTGRRHQFFGTLPSLWSNSHNCTWPLGRPSVQFSSVTQSCPTLCDPLNCSTPGLPKTIALTRWTFVGRVMSPLLNTLSRFVIAAKKQSSSAFMAAVTICSDFRAQ